MENTSFITNRDGETLQDRFKKLLKHTKAFDSVVGYFYVSGFHSIYKSLEDTDKIRILIGISTDKNTYEQINKAVTKEVKEYISERSIKDVEDAEDSLSVEEGISKFIEWIESGKLEIKVYPTERIHAKMYILHYKEDGTSEGEVITGSSNLTKSGLITSHEFNVHLRRPEDYIFAKEKFENLWKDSINVTEDFVENIKTKTWFNQDITPYELYLKFLYEYLKEELSAEDDFNYEIPEEFMDLRYQADAVSDAKRKLKRYGGVFIADVVGLGKTFTTALLAKQLSGQKLVIAPPSLLNEKNPGSWPNVFRDFFIGGTKFKSIGKLDHILREGFEKYDTIIIDEAHRFRTETTEMYAKLSEICRGKKVVLVSATPLNNSPKDILAQIKLFQNTKNSNIPNPKVRNLEDYFNKLDNNLKGLDRSKNKKKYHAVVKENAEDIRNNVLKYLMVRRTRNMIKKYYAHDLKQQNLKFPNVNDPKPNYYSFDEGVDNIFNKTIDIITHKFNYSRYTPLLYLKNPDPSTEVQQKNMGKFMKLLLLKRLESSFYAFRQSIERFIHSYNQVIGEYEKGRVYVSKKHFQKILDYIESDDDNSIQKLIENKKADKYESKEFKSNFITDLKSDLKILKNIQEMWKEVDIDPKLNKLLDVVKRDKNLKDNKLIIFSESKDTVDYLHRNLGKIFKNKVFKYSGSSSQTDLERVLENFDANYDESNQKDDIKILITTDTLSEGVSLHRSNVVLNYDIPWNPVRMMQRVGRINRVGKNLPFDEIFTYNFFPTGLIDDPLKLVSAAEAKITAFIEMLGSDSKLLTDEEVKSHELFNKLLSRDSIVGDESESNPELEQLMKLRELRNDDPLLFKKIKNLPKKIRLGKTTKISSDAVITFFKKGDTKAIFKIEKDESRELSFAEAVDQFECGQKTKKFGVKSDFYELLDKNKKAFEELFIQPYSSVGFLRGQSSTNKLYKKIKAIMNSSEFRDIDDDYIDTYLNLISEGGLPKHTAKKVYRLISKDTEPLKILSKIKSNTPDSLFKARNISSINTSGPKEVILSEYLIKDGKN